MSAWSPGARPPHSGACDARRVAHLAGVGITWYTWFEQGREIQVSAHFLENLARQPFAGLDAAEARATCSRLRSIGRRRSPGFVPQAVTPALKEHAGELSPTPATLQDTRAWDPRRLEPADDDPCSAITPPFPPERRNILCSCSRIPSTAS